MRLKFFLVHAIILAFVSVGAAAPLTRNTFTLRAPRPAVTPPVDEFVPGEVLVKFRAGVATAKTEPLNGDLGLVRADRIDDLRIERYVMPGGGDVWETVRRLRQRPDVEYAEPNFVAHLAAVPDDTFYSQVEGHARDLQRWTFGGIEGDTGINAEAAWDITTGRPDVTIAVVDSGVSYTHPDIAPNLWTNPGEIPGNGVDDDHNGFVDDVHGWDFYGSDPDSNPDLGNGRNDDGVGIGDDNVFHGTFAANLAAGRGDNGYGIAGAAWNCRIMSLKVFTDDGGANNFHIAAAFDYAADNGADVVNASLETRTDSSAIRDAVAHAVASDCVVVAAAGNGDSASPVYPAAYPTVLSVGATDHAFESPSLVQALGPARFTGRGNFSNYGIVAVDVVAPGVVFSSSVASQTDADADSTLQPGDVVGFAAAGTSFSSPIAAGLAALLVSRDKDLNGVRTLTNAEIIDIIQNTAEDLPNDPADQPDGGELWDNHGRIDFLAAVESVSGGTSGRIVRLGWNAPSGDALAPPSDLMATDSSSSKAAALSKLAIAEQEPNNTLATAQPISVPSSVDGQISTSDRRGGEEEIVYSDGSSNDVIEDLYRISLSEQATLSITLTPNGNSDLDLALLTDLDGDGQYTVEQAYLANDIATGPQEPESLKNRVLPAGTYYVACTIYDDIALPFVTSDTYHLEVSLGDPIVNGYRVYRSTTPGVPVTDATRIAQVSGAQLTFVDTNAPEGAVYYIVTAVYDAGESDPSNEAEPGAANPNAPVIINPTLKNSGKFLLDAAGSKIVAGSMLVVDDAQTFTLTLTKNGSKWQVKKKARSVPGSLLIKNVLVAGQPSRMYVVTPTGLRSATVMFTR